MTKGIAIRIKQLTDSMHSKTCELVFGKGFEKYLGLAYFEFTVPNRTNTQIADDNQVISIKGKGFIISYLVNQKSEIGVHTFN